MGALRNRFLAKVEKTDTCWLWRGAVSWTRGNIHVRGRVMQATHVSMYLFRGKWPPKGWWVWQRCRVHLCVNPDHLLMGTPKRHGEILRARRRRVGGRGVGGPKLTEAEVLEMRRLYATGKYTGRELGKMFNTTSVFNVLARRSWRRI